MPKASICIPTYNKELYLPAAIESALGQDYDDFEVIVSDNASTDNTPEICRSYADPRLRYVRFGEVGQTANVNHCLSLARGDYQTLLCDDDVLHPAFLSRAASVMDEHPRVGMVHCSVRNIDGAGAPLSLRALHAADLIEPGETMLRRLLIDGCAVSIAGVLVRRTVYEKTGGFSGLADWGIDWHLWMRIAMHSDAAYLSETLAQYRVHAANLTQSVLLGGRNGPAEVRLLDDIFSRIPVERRDLHSLRPLAMYGVAHRTWCVAEDFCRQGNGPAARTQLSRSVRISPGILLESRVAALWAATYLGYDWFERIHKLKTPAR